MLRVPPRRPVEIAALHKLPQGVGAHRVEEPVGHRRPPGLRRDHRLAHQVRDRVDRVVLVDPFAGDNRCGRVQREAAGHGSEPGEDLLLQLGEKLIAPVDGGAERLVARERGAPPLREQAEAVIEVFGKAAQPEDTDATGRQFDGERNAVEPAADVDDQRRVGVAHLKPVVARPGALDEELHRRVSHCLGRREPGGGRRQVERTETEYPFARRAKRLPAGREHMHASGAAEDAFGQTRRGFDHVLAIVEDDQHVLAGKEGDQAGKRILRRDGKPEH